MYTIQEVLPCAKTKQMQMKVKMKVKMFGQRFHLWRSFQQAPISFHFISFNGSDLRLAPRFYCTNLFQIEITVHYTTVFRGGSDHATWCNDFELDVELPEQVELEASTSTSTSTIVLRSARASFLQYSTHLSPLIAFYCSLVRGGAVVGATSRTYTYSEFMDGWFVAWRT